MAKQFSNKENLNGYYNRKAITHVFFIAFFYFLFDFFIIDYDQELDYSLAFYFKCLIMGFYSFSSSQLVVSEIEASENYELVHDFTGASLCIWVACVDYFVLMDTTSYFSVIFLLFALFTSFNCTIKLPFILKNKINSIWPFRVCMLFIQLLLLSELILIVLIVIDGEWKWIFSNPFYLISSI